LAKNKIYHLVRGTVDAALTSEANWTGILIRLPTRDLVLREPPVAGEDETAAGPLFVGSAERQSVSPEVDAMIKHGERANKAV